MAAKAKEDKEDGKNGRGGGRGRGKGRGKGRGRTKKPAQAPEDVPEKSGDDMDMSMKPAKRANMCTPERRQLFPESGDDKVTPTKGSQGGAMGSSGEPPVSSPPVRQKKAKRAKRSQKTPKKTEPDQKETTGDKCLSVDQPPKGDASEPKDACNLKGNKPKNEPAPPTATQIAWAQATFDENQGDPSFTFFAKKMFGAVKEPERNCATKMKHWGFSMYWDARRVGVLQAKGEGKKKKVHVFCFSGRPSCTHIGIPMAAALMYVGISVAVQRPHACRKSVHMYNTHACACSVIQSHFLNQKLDHMFKKYFLKRNVL
jgi:hypothetical protein